MHDSKTPFTPMAHTKQDGSLFIHPFSIHPHTPTCDSTKSAYIPRQWPAMRRDSPAKGLYTRSVLAAAKAPLIWGR